MNWISFWFVDDVNKRGRSITITITKNNIYWKLWRMVWK